MRAWLHRRGIARVLNCYHEGGGRVSSVYVETALPLRLLAYYAAHAPHVRLYHARITRHEHHGLLRRRWMLKP